MILELEINVILTYMHTIDMLYIYDLVISTSMRY